MDNNNKGVKRRAEEMEAGSAVIVVDSDGDHHAAPVRTDSKVLRQVGRPTSAMSAVTSTSSGQPSTPTFISAFDIVERDIEQYAPPEIDQATFLQEVQKVTIKFPYGDTEETFPLCLPICHAKALYNPVFDLLRLLTIIADETPGFRDAERSSHHHPNKHHDKDDDQRKEEEEEDDERIVRQIEKALRKQAWPLVQQHCTRFNEIIERLRQKPPQLPSTKTWTLDQTVRLLDSVYERCITDPTLLNKYESFSHKVYGETRPPLIDQMIHKDLKEAFRTCKVFVDLGSGIGNVVLQVALQTQAKCYGVELMETPAGFARDQLAEYRHRLKMIHHVTDRAHLRQGDFLEDPKVVKLIEKANIVFVNNYAFGSKIDNALSHLFLGLRDGAKIISLRSFRPLDWRVSDWNIGDFASILRVEKFGYAEGSVSWTSSVGEYFVQTVDRTEVQRFLKEKKQRARRR